RRCRSENAGRVVNQQEKRPYCLLRHSTARDRSQRTMQTKLDEAKAELLERAARVAENSPVGGHLPTGTTDESTPDRETVLAFLQRYYLHTAPEDLADRDPVDVFGAAYSHYR